MRTDTAKIKERANLPAVRHRSIILASVTCAILVTACGGGSKNSPEEESAGVPTMGMVSSGQPVGRAGNDAVVVAANNAAVSLPANKTAPTEVELTPADNLDQSVLGLIGVPVGSDPVSVSPAMRIRVAPAPLPGFDLTLPYNQASLGLDQVPEEYIVVVGVQGQNYVVVPGYLLGSKITAKVTNLRFDEGIYQAFRSKAPIDSRSGELASVPSTPAAGSEAPLPNVPSADALVDILLAGMNVEAPPPAAPASARETAPSNVPQVSETSGNRSESVPSTTTTIPASESPESITSPPTTAPVTLVDMLLQNFTAPSSTLPSSDDSDAPNSTSTTTTMPVSSISSLSDSAASDSAGQESPGQDASEQNSEEPVVHELVPTFATRVIDDPEFRLSASKTFDARHYDATRWEGDSFKDLVIPRSISARRVPGPMSRVIQITLKFSTTDCFYINSSRSPRRFILAECTAGESGGSQIATQSVELAIIPGADIPDMEATVSYLDFLSFERLLELDAPEKSETDFALLKARLEANEKRLAELTEDHALLLLGLTERMAEVDRTEREKVAALAVEADELSRKFASERELLRTQLAAASTSSAKKVATDALSRLDRTQKAEEQRIARAALSAAKSAASARKKLNDSKTSAERNFARLTSSLERSSRAITERISQREGEIRILESRMDIEQARAVESVKAKEEERSTALAKLADEHRANLARIDSTLESAEVRLAALEQAAQNGEKISSRTISSARSDVSRWKKAREAAIATYNRRVASTSARFDSDILRIENTLRERLKSLTHRIEVLRNSK